jgi:hypothetical protein
MSERIKRELALVAVAYGDLEVDQDLRWFVVKRWPLIPGWNKQCTRVLILLPPGYAVTPPDNFYTDADLAVKGGAQPGSTSAAQPINGQPWLQFSYHIEASDWQPENGHNLLTFLGGVDRRLREAN